MRISSWYEDNDNGDGNGVISRNIKNTNICFRNFWNDDDDINDDNDDILKIVKHKRLSPKLGENFLRESSRSG